MKKTKRTIAILVAFTLLILAAGMQAQAATCKGKVGSGEWAQCQNKH
jgi:carbohydrate-selective porin OprB